MQETPPFEVSNIIRHKYSDQGTNRQYRGTGSTFELLMSQQRSHKNE